MKTLLVHYDSGSNLSEIVDSAINLNSLFKTTLTFVHIQEKEDKGGQDLQEKLKNVVRNKNLNGTKVEYILQPGKTYHDLVEIAKKVDARTIVTRYEKKKGFVLFKDNTAFNTVVSAPCPVFTLSDNVHIKPIRHILLPIDTSHETRQKIPLAITLAKHFNAVIHLVAFGTDKGNLEQKTILQNYLEQSRHYIREKGVNAQTELVYGKNVVESINQYCEKNDINLLIVTTDQDTSLFTSSAEKIVETCPVPVLNIQPKDLKVSWAGL